MYKRLLTLVRALQLVELNLLGSLANIEQNNTSCDSKKYFRPLKMKKIFLLFHNLFWKKPLKIKSRVML